MKSEIPIYRPEALTAEGLKGFFADIFVSLDACPRELAVCVDVPDGADAIIDLVDGNPVFAVCANSVDAASSPRHGMVQPTLFPADFRRRWLAEHPVPLVLKAGRTARLSFVPADANRVRVLCA